jgi:hypothetical protein
LNITSGGKIIRVLIKTPVVWNVDERNDKSVAEDEVIQGDNLPEKKEKEVKKEKPFDFAFYYSSPENNDLKRLEYERRYIEVCLKQVNLLKAQCDSALEQAENNILGNQLFGCDLSTNPVPISQVHSGLVDYLKQKILNEKLGGMSSQVEVNQFFQNATINVRKGSCAYLIRFQPIRTGDVAFSPGVSLRALVDIIKPR